MGDGFSSVGTTFIAVITTPGEPQRRGDRQVG
jgi:hypothetical protein